jgi:hypothetical protein
MARWAAAIPTWLPVAVADTTAMTTLGFHGLQGGSTTQRGEVREIYLGGQAGASAPTYMVFGRCSTVGAATLTATRLAALDPATAALAAPPVPYQTTSGAFPQRSATLGMLLNLSFNAFGGIVRWYAGPDQVISYLGNTASLGELSLNAFTGGTPGQLGSNIVFETL